MKNNRARIAVTVAVSTVAVVAALSGVLWVRSGNAQVAASIKRAKKLHVPTTVAEAFPDADAPNPYDALPKVGAQPEIDELIDAVRVTEPATAYQKTRFHTAAQGLRVQTALITNPPPPLATYFSLCDGAASMPVFVPRNERKLGSWLPASDFASRDEACTVMLISAKTWAYLGRFGHAFQNLKTAIQMATQGSGAENAAIAEDCCKNLDAWFVAARQVAELCENKPAWMQRVLDLGQSVHIPDLKTALKGEFASLRQAVADIGENDWDALSKARPNLRARLFAYRTPFQAALIRIFMPRSEATALDNVLEQYQEVGDPKKMRRTAMSLGADTVAGLILPPRSALISMIDFSLKQRALHLLLFRELLNRASHLPFETAAQEASKLGIDPALMHALAPVQLQTAPGVMLLRYGRGAYAQSLSIQLVRSRADLVRLTLPGAPPVANGRFGKKVDVKLQNAG